MATRYARSCSLCVWSICVIFLDPLDGEKIQRSESIFIIIVTTRPILIPPTFCPHFSIGDIQLTLKDNMADPNLFTTPFQLTRSMHRDVYPAVDPRNPEFSAKGKIVIITGAGGALGSVSSSDTLPMPICNPNLRFCSRQSQKRGLRPVLPVSFSLDARSKLSI